MFSFQSGSLSREGESGRIASFKPSDMFRPDTMFFKRKKSQQAPEAADAQTPNDAPGPREPTAGAEPDAKPAPGGIFARIKQGLSRTSGHFAEGMGNLILGAKVNDGDLIGEIESQLRVADVGMEATDQMIDGLTDGITRKQLSSPEA